MNNKKLERLATPIVRKKVCIANYLNDNNRISGVKNRSAIYLFWYKNNGYRLKNLSRTLKVKCSGDKKYQSFTWRQDIEKKYVCLYVGRTTRLQDRLNEHLLSGDPKNLYKNKKHVNHIRKKYRKHGEYGKKMRAKPENKDGCQFRSGFDYLYRNRTDEINIFYEIRKHVYISIYDESDFFTRCYLEHYLIGMLQPWFNLDAES